MNTTTTGFNRSGSSLGVKCGRKPTDLMGFRYPGSRLVAVKWVMSSDGRSRWLCECDCGNTVEVGSSDLQSGKTRSCGCLNREIVSRRNIGNQYGLTQGGTLGEVASSTYQSWVHVIQRCTNPNNDHWEHYGGAPIPVLCCDRWLKSFVAFREDMGERPEGTSLGRYLDSGNYEKSNCAWQTDAEQKAEAMGKRAMLALHAHHQKNKKRAA